MSSELKGFLALAAFILGTVVSGAAFAGCAGHGSKTAHTYDGKVTVSGTVQETKKPATGG